MRKFIDIFCLVGWSILLTFGILASFGVCTINPICYVLACIGYIIHYAGKIFTWGDDVSNV